MTPSEIIDIMMSRDEYSQWLGIQRLEEDFGKCKLQMTIRHEMCNGFGIAHGGISYTLCDSALAFASNSHGRHAVSIETTISHIKPLQIGDVITATATEQSLTNRIGIYQVEVERNGQLVALFKGTVFRKDELW